VVRRLYAILVLVAVFVSARYLGTEWARVEAVPDTRLAQWLDHTPNEGDLARLRSVEGKRKATILHVLGHPYQVEQLHDGEEVWHYQWSASCRVWIRNGICSGTHYSPGW
jgi:hypothetical protein